MRSWRTPPFVERVHGGGGETKEDNDPADRSSGRDRHGKLTTSGTKSRDSMGPHPRVRHPTLTARLAHVRFMAHRQERERASESLFVVFAEFLASLQSWSISCRCNSKCLSRT